MYVRYGHCRSSTDDADARPTIRPIPKPIAHVCRCARGRYACKHMTPTSSNSCHAVRARITRADDGIPFIPADDHHGVHPVRLHGGAAGATERMSVGRSYFSPAARVDRGPVAGETLYVVVTGELNVQIADQESTPLRAGDSAYLPKGTARALQAGTDGATIIVIRNP